MSSEQDRATNLKKEEMRRHGVLNVKRTRRLKPETLAREVAMAEAESGRTPGR